MSNENGFIPSLALQLSKHPVLIVAFVAIWNFSAEAMIMLLFTFFPAIDPMIEPVLDAGLLTIFTIPVFFFILYRPIVASVADQKRLVSLRSAELAKAKEYSENIIASMQDCLVVLDHNCTIQTINQPLLTILGYQKNDLIQRDLCSLVEENLATELQALISQDKGFTNTNVHFHTKDGRKIAMSLAGSTMWNEAGELHQFVITARDMTKINTLIEELRASKKANEAVIRELHITKAANEAAIKKTQYQDWLKTGESELNVQLRGEPGMEQLTERIISFLAGFVSAQIGVFFVMKANTLNLIASYAHTRRNTNNNILQLGEGLVGQAALEKKPIVFQDIPDDHVNIIIASGIGKSTPKMIIVLPLVHNNDVKGVIELGASRNFSDLEIEFLHRVTKSIAISITTTAARLELQTLLNQTRKQTAALEEQQEELRATNEELLDSKTILEFQSVELQTSNTELTNSKTILQNQSEELQAANEELEEKSESLERQTQELKKQKSILEKTQSVIAEKARELEETSRYKSEFLANMSHELRTPLNSLLILSKSLANNNKGNLTTKQVESATIIHSSGQDLLNLINDILDLSKIEAGKLTVRDEQVGLQDLITDIKRQFDHVATNKSLEFITNINAGLPTVITSDGLRLAQIIRNLLANAFKFTEQGNVQLTLKPTPADHVFANAALTAANTITFAVTDTGIGISKDKQLSIFEAFQQEDGSISRRFGGTGLGLTISRQLARLLGGDIQLTSKFGEGSTFSLYLPFTKQDGAVDTTAVIDMPTSTPSASASTTTTTTTTTEVIPAAVEPATPKVTPPTKTETITNIDTAVTLNPNEKSLLIVEDDTTFAEILMELGRGQGYRCLHAATGRNGIILAQENNPNGIILDLGLPDINGKQVLEQLKNNVITRHIPVHIISANDSNPTFRKMGAMGFITKPATQESLTAALAEIEALASTAIRDVLLIEDDSSSRTAISQLITNDATQVMAVGTGEQALLALQQQPFACIILDLKLPDMTGFEWLQQAKTKQLALPPVIIHTGRDLSEEEVAELGRHSQSVIIKGVHSPERLLDEVSLFLHSVDAKLPDNQKQVLAALHDPDLVLKNKHVLLVDDDVRNVYALCEILEDTGLKLTGASNGQQALDILATETDINIVIMDIMMPIMDGYEAMRQIRAQPQFQTLPIIALTAKAMPEDRVLCIDAGASDYLTKPVDQDRLLSMLRVWLFN